MGILIIDESILNSGITESLVAELITMHEETTERYHDLFNYYIGKHSILNRTRSSEDAPNNKTVCNHAKYIVDLYQSYLTGNPITYAPADGYDIEPLKEAYLEQDIANLDSDLMKNTGIYGRIYELVYANEQSQPRSVMIAPENAFVCYSQTADRRPLLGVHYYRKYGLDGTCTGIVCNVYDDSFVYMFESSQESYFSMTLIGTQAHHFSEMPLIEYQNNQECQGDFEQQISLIDSYNTLMSDRINDKEQFVDAFLFLRGIDLTSKQAKALKREKILMGNEDAKAEYLSKVMNEADIKVLRDDIKEDIHRFSMAPDLSDESFGSNLSGVAIRYKLFGFEQRVKNKQRYFTKSLKRRFRLYNQYLASLSKMKEIPVHQVDVVFTYSLPSNELELSQMVSNLKGTVSDVTLLDQLPFVSDAEEEYKITRQEKEEEIKRQLRRYDDMTDAGGYNRTLDDIENE